MKKLEADSSLVASAIYFIRKHRVMLDSHLAHLYGVETRILIQAVKRNKARFPEDFAFQLTANEVQLLRSQIVILKNQGRGQHTKYLPHVFTEQGVAMLSSVLKSPRAIEMNVTIMRAFVKIREILSTNKALVYKLAELERRIENHDENIRDILAAIRQLMTPPAPTQRKIGFQPQR